jgi:NAD+ synthase (glutamine-hydrolysing)
MWQQRLEEYRKNRNFNTENYINCKTILINEYMKLINHNCVIVGISGGVDSACVLGLIIKSFISNLKISPIKKIVAINIPEFVDGTCNQYDSYNKSYLLVKEFEKKYNISIDFICADLSLIHNQIKSNIGMNINSWASGQIVSYLRTTMLYSYVSAYYSMGYKALLCGTTNFDEGSYIGYFGKSSDGCVDIQIISDLHKSEVFKVAKFLGVIDLILEAKPSSDLYNNLTDEEYIGAPYDFMELYFGHLVI